VGSNRPAETIFMLAIMYPEPHKCRAMIRLLRSIGPAIIVAAVVLGPGSILTSSKVGANLGLIGLPFVALATVLMITLVAISAQVGVSFEKSPCEEIAQRLGRGASVFIGVVLFIIAAFFQSSNNLSLLGGLEALIYSTGESLDFNTAVLILIIVNALLILMLYKMRHLYEHVEDIMKVMVGMMVLAFLINFIAVMTTSPKEVAETTAKPDILPLIALMGTTYVTAGAFYQAYLVREKNWGIQDVQRSRTDSIISITILGCITMVILASSWRIFYGTPQAAQLGGIADVARQLDPVFGPWARIIFSLGILAGALSSFLVNSMVGGTVLSDGLGKGSRLTDHWPVHWTSVALVVGMVIAIFSKVDGASTVHLITIAQALTVVGAPALAIALVYLATRPEMKGERQIPKGFLYLGFVAILVSCILSALTVRKIIAKLTPEEKKQAVIMAGQESPPFYLGMDQ